MKTLKFVALVALLSVAQFSLKVEAQTPKVLKCGDIIEGETAISDQNFLSDIGFRGKRYGDSYSLGIQAGTKVNMIVMPLGASYNVAFGFMDSAKNVLFFVNKKGDGIAESVNDYSLASSNQMLIVVGAKPGFDKDTPAIGRDQVFNVTYDGDFGLYFGAYRITIGCTLRDGKVIEPGDTAPATTGNTVPVTFSGVGFPGLPSVDFSKVAKIPLPIGLAMSGAITPTGSEIIGYVFDGKANATPELSFTRLSGNLNLGLVVLSADNKVVYQASLVNSKTMTTTFTTPKDGKYTVGVFKIDLLPPASPEATAFQIQIKQ